jgi:hypothetical protein
MNRPRLTLSGEPEGAGLAIAVAGRGCSTTLVYESFGLAMSEEGIGGVTRLLHIVLVGTFSDLKRLST